MTRALQASGGFRDIVLALYATPGEPLDHLLPWQAVVEQTGLVREWVRTIVLPDVALPIESMLDVTAIVTSAVVYSIHRLGEMPDPANTAQLVLDVVRFGYG